jgi:hypothetical protein
MTVIHCSPLPTMIIVLATRQKLMMLNKLLNESISLSQYLICRLLKFCYVRATTSTTVLAFFAAATASTNETNKAGGMCH